MSVIFLSTSVPPYLLADNISHCLSPKYQPLFPIRQKDSSQVRQTMGRQHRASLSQPAREESLLDLLPFTNVAERGKARSLVF